MNSANDVNKGRWMVLAFASVVLLTGFILGRLSASSDPTASAETKAASATPVAGAPAQSPAMPGYATAAAPAGAMNPAYPGGLAQTANGFDPAMPPEFRSGYSEGFKQGFAEASTRVTSNPVPRTNTVVTRRVYYTPTARPVYYEKKKNSTLKTVLTIAAPAAIGAGVGAAVAGGKGAGAGALIGGGGGALYHLIRNH